MKKRLYTLVITFCVLLALGIGIWILVLQPNMDDEDTDKKTIPIGITGYANNSDQVTVDVKRLTIINQAGEINLTPIPRDDTSTVSSAKWRIAELDNAESGDWSANDMALAFYIIQAVRKFDVDPEKLGQYGLDNPNSTVRIAFNDGNTFEYRFGDKLAISGKAGGYYVMRDDDPTVYVVEDYYYTKAQVELKNVVNYHMLDAIEDIGLVSKTIIYGPGYKEEIEIEPIPEGQKSPVITATHRFVKPTLREMPTTTSANLFKSISDLNAKFVAAAAKGSLSKEVLAQYGLDNPQKMITFNNNGTVHTLKGGKQDGSYVYVQLDNIPMVYALAVSSVDDWYFADFDAMAYRMMYAVYKKDVKTITFETNGKSYRFDITTNEDDEVSGVTLNGVKAGKDAYEDLFKEFIGIAYKERDSKTYSAAPELKVTVLQKNGTTDVIKLVPATARTHMYFKNGKGGYLVSYEYVQNIQEFLRAAQNSTKD